MGTEDWLGGVRPLDSTPWLGLYCRACFPTVSPSPPEHSQPQGISQVPQHTTISIASLHSSVVNNLTVPSKGGSSSLSLTTTCLWCRTPCFICVSVSPSVFSTGTSPASPLPPVPRAAPFLLFEHFLAHSSCPLNQSLINLITGISFPRFIQIITQNAKSLFRCDA